MAADHRVGERVYQELRRRLLKGKFRLRERIEPAHVAGELGVSTTPVREALVRLTAERLLTLQPSRGFFMRLWSEAELAALYEWRALLVTTAASSPVARPPSLVSAEYPDRVTELFGAIESVANAELRHAGAQADARLQLARRAEAALSAAPAVDLAKIEAALSAGRPDALRRALRAYHVRRVSEVRAVRERAMLEALGGNGEA